MPWVATIDAFQHWIYTHPEHSQQDRTAFWLELSKRFGGPIDWVDLSAEQEAAWHRQLHPFEVPFYYVEYGIAQLGALQMWLQYCQDAPSAIKAYKAGLSLGGSKPLPQLFNAAGLSFDFNVDMVSKLIDAVEAALEKYS